jgi:hypothetical protein
VKELLKSFENTEEHNESPRRKQRGIKDQNRKKHSPQAAGYLPEEKNKKAGEPYCDLSWMWDELGIEREELH